MRAFFDVTQGQRGIDHAEMREGLRKISERIACLGIDLFREKIDIVRETERGFINFVRFIESTTAREKIDFPKTAKRERTLMSTFALFVALDQTFSWNQSLPNSRVGFLHALRARVFEAVIRHEQRARVNHFI